MSSPVCTESGFIGRSQRCCSLAFCALCSGTDLLRTEMRIAEGVGSEWLGCCNVSSCRTEYFGRLSMVKVSFGSIASFCRSAHDFRASPGSGHRQGRSPCLKGVNRRRTGKKKLSSDVNWFTSGNAATAISLDPISGPISGRLAGPHNNGVQRC